MFIWLTTKLFEFIFQTQIHPEAMPFIYTFAFVELFFEIAFIVAIIAGEIYRRHLLRKGKKS